MQTAIHSPALASAVTVPKEFISSEIDEPLGNAEEMEVPTVDLHGFFSGDAEATREAAEAVAEACRVYGIFQVVNHGIEPEVLEQGLSNMGRFFELPFDVKERIKRVLGDSYGYTNSFVGRFNSNLPWKETLSLRHLAAPPPPASPVALLEEYFENGLGEGYREIGSAFGNYCESVCGLGLVLLELLGLGLGLGQTELRSFFESSDSILRLNYYPKCPEPKVALGTYAHCDPNCLTVLHQDGVKGMEIQMDDNKWYSAYPKPNALFIIAGQTLVALCNGRLKSCSHRAVVNSVITRKSMAFFLSPNANKVVAAPKGLVDEEDENPRKYPDFTWSMLLDFTQKNHRVDTKTLEEFTKWLLENPKNNVIA